jgi:tetraacyldisaccharide 4'-kinase
MYVIREKIENVMNSEEKSRFSSIDIFLLIISACFGVLICIKNGLYSLKLFRQKKLPCKVISIGNITVGGTGKTPMAIYLAEKLTVLGYKIVVISRGYKGNFEKKGGIISNGKNILVGSVDSGDEPFLIAAKLKDVPVVVGKNRYNAGLLSVRSFSPDVVLLDDGFQHRKLFRDINLLLMDSKRPFGNGRLFPRGILREPAGSINRADLFVITRSSSDNTKALKSIRTASCKQPIFEAYNNFYFFRVVQGSVSNNIADYYSQLSDDFTAFAGKRVAAFSGIAGNEHFRKTISEFRCDLVDFSGFPDHHRYSDEDIRKISKRIREKEAEFVMTTEKDFARMGVKFEFPVDLIVVGVKMCLKNEKSFMENIVTGLKHHE